MGVRVLVCGGRDFTDRDMLFGALDALHKLNGRIDCIIHGAARGADFLAGEWAGARGIAVESYPANWTGHGKAAGTIRNQKMLDEGKPDMVMAMPGGRGTRDMIDRAKRRGLAVHRSVYVR